MLKINLVVFNLLSFCFLFSEKEGVQMNAACKSEGNKNTKSIYLFFFFSE